MTTITRILLELGIAVALAVAIIVATATHLQNVKDEAHTVGRPMGRISNLQAEAELYFGNNQTYNGFCATKNAQYFISTPDIGGAPLECNDSKDEWAAGIILPIKGAYYCADSTGARSTTVRGLQSGETKCPPEQPW